MSMLLDKEELNELYRYALALCNHRDDAQDLLQAAVEKYLIELQHARKQIHNSQAFLRTTIRNRFIDQHRYRKRWQGEPFEEKEHYNISPLRPEDFCVNSQTLEHLWELLSPQERDVLYHWAVLGYSTDEACQLLDMPRGSFLSCIHRMRKKFEPGTDYGVEEA